MLYTQTLPDLPTTYNAEEIRLLVFVHEEVGTLDEPFLLPVGADRTGAYHRLAEVSVYWRSADRIYPLQLARRANIESLKKRNIVYASNTTISACYLVILPMCNVMFHVFIYFILLNILSRDARFF